jgi:hypothetical protein
MSRVHLRDAGVMSWGAAWASGPLETPWVLPTAAGAAYSALRGS